MVNGKEQPLFTIHHLPFTRLWRARAAERERAARGGDGAAHLVAADRALEGEVGALALDVERRRDAEAVPRGRAVRDVGGAEGRLDATRQARALLLERERAGYLLRPGGRRDVPRSGERAGRGRLSPAARRGRRPAAPAARGRAAGARRRERAGAAPDDLHGAAHLASRNRPREDGVGRLARGRGERDGHGEVDVRARRAPAGDGARAELPLQRAGQAVALLLERERAAHLLPLVARAAERDVERPGARGRGGAARRGGRGAQLDLPAVDEEVRDATVAREE